MRVAVVGPTGVLGRALLPMLVQRGHAVRALARSGAKARLLFPHATDIVECDLLADVAGALPAMLDGCDAVLHIATAIPSDFTAPDAWDANTRLRTDGVRKLLDASLKAGVGRYVQQSITMAYPDHGDDWIGEDLPLDSTPQRGQVGSPVIGMEDMVRATPPAKLEWCILRGGSFVGQDTFQDNTIARLRAGAETVAGDGGNYVSFIHVADMASATVAAIELAPAGSTFNIVDEPIRNGEYLDRLADSIGAVRPTRNLAAKRPPSWRCSNRAAKAALGWSPTHGIFP